MTATSTSRSSAELTAAFETGALPKFKLKDGPVMDMVADTSELEFPYLGVRLYPLMPLGAVQAAPPLEA
ncbi:hypothetical protein GCM10022631_28450 [Deinococcus rubellus]|uniref:hypothetical protein n=1 Tax=Deinococcus rubellus TaxID=1889240 RepID=UPI0031E6E2A3